MKLRNNMAVVGGAFMIVWTGMLALFTWLFVRDGGFRQFHPLAEAGVRGLFWTVGLAGCSYFFAVPRVALLVDGGQAELRERRLLRRRQERFPEKGVLASRFVEDKDSEGDP